MVLANTEILSNIRELMKYVPVEKKLISFDLSCSTLYELNTNLD